MLRHYDWENDTIDGFKSRLQQYKLKMTNGTLGLKTYLCFHMGASHLKKQ
jgi:hypothetical protein